MDNFQIRANQLFIDLSLYWPRLTDAEREVIAGLAGVETNLGFILSAVRSHEGRFASQFLPVAEAILNRHFNIDEPDLQQQNDANQKATELEDLQKDYCVLYEINQRMEKRLERLERKQAKRQAKQERVKRYFRLRGRKGWDNDACDDNKQTLPIHIRLQQPLSAPRKRLVKGTPEYEAEMKKLDEELDEYQAEVVKSQSADSCDHCENGATFRCGCGEKSCESHTMNRATVHGWVLIQ